MIHGGKRHKMGHDKWLCPSIPLPARGKTQPHICLASGLRDMLEIAARNSFPAAGLGWVQCGFLGCRKALSTRTSPEAKSLVGRSADSLDAERR